MRNFSKDILDAGEKLPNTEEVIKANANSDTLRRIRKAEDELRKQIAEIMTGSKFGTARVEVLVKHGQVAVVKMLPQFDYQ